MDETLTEADEGKRVVGPEGELLGTVDKVDQGVAHVDPDGDAPEAIRERLDRGNQDDYTFQETAVAESTDDEIVLRGEE